MKRFPSLATLAVLVSAQVFGGFAIQSAQAAVITWGSATTISGNTDVNTVGTLFQAANFAGLTRTVNGVQFAAFSGTSNGNIRINYGQEFPTTFGANNAPFNTLSSDYQELLRSAGIFANNVTISGLSIGAQYSIQYWANDSRGISGIGTRITTLTSGVNSVDLDVNSTNAAGGVGQWVLGTFTADSTSQSFSISGVGSSYSNAMQVRTVVVPEPETLAGLGVIGGGLAAFIRRRFRTVKSAS